MRSIDSTTMSASRRAPGADLRDLVEPHDRRRRVDRIHHVVERDGERVDVLTIERRDERAVQTIDDAARLSVADVLDVLDRIRLAPCRAGRSTASASSVRAPSWICWDKRDELVEELLLSGNETEGHALLETRSTRHRSRSRYTAVTSSVRLDGLRRGQRNREPCKERECRALTGVNSGLIPGLETGTPLGDRRLTQTVEGHMKPVAAAVAGALISGAAMYTVGASTATVDAFTPDRAVASR